MREASLVPAKDQETARAAFLSTTYGLTGTADPTVFTADVAAGTFGTPYPIGSLVEGFAVPMWAGIAQDTATGTAVVGTYDLFDFTSPPTIATVDLDTGEMRSFAGLGTSMTGLAVDSATGTVLGTTNVGVGLYDLAAQTGRLVPLGGFGYTQVAFDATHGRYVVEEFASPDSRLFTPGGQQLQPFHY